MVLCIGQLAAAPAHAQAVWDEVSGGDPGSGLVALTLALLGIAGSWQDRTARLFGGIALGGLLFALGHNSVFHGVLYALVPMVEKARSPSMAVFIFHFGLCVLIAYGIDSYHLIDRVILKRVAWLLTAFSGVVGAALVFAFAG